MTSVDLAASTANGGLVARPMRQADVDAVVELHLAAFPDNFLTGFGERFLNAFYSGLTGHSSGFGCVVTDDADRPLGFCVGGVGEAQGIARAMLLRRPLAFLWPAALNVIRSPRRLGRVLELAQRNLTGGRAGVPDSTALLMQIAVTEPLRGAGAAERMLRHFLEEMRRRGVTSVRLGVEPENARAKAFYRRVGFRELDAGTFEHNLIATGPAHG